MSFEVDSIAISSSDYEIESIYSGPVSWRLTSVLNLGPTSCPAEENVVLRIYVIKLLYNILWLFRRPSVSGDSVSHGVLSRASREQLSARTVFKNTRLANVCNSNVCY